MRLPVTHRICVCEFHGSSCVLCAFTLHIFVCPVCAYLPCTFVFSVRAFVSRTIVCSMHPHITHLTVFCGSRGLTSRAGDVAVDVFDINQPSLSASFYSLLASFSVFMALSTVFYSITSPDNSPLSHCSSGLLSALLVLSTRYLLMKVSFSPDLILRG